MKLLYKHLNYLESIFGPACGLVLMVELLVILKTASLLFGGHP